MHEHNIHNSWLVAQTLSADKQSGETVPYTDETPENNEDKSDVAIEECAAVQTRAMVANEKKPPKPLKVKSQVKAKQKHRQWYVCLKMKRQTYQWQIHCHYIIQNPC